MTLSVERLLQFPLFSSVEHALLVKLLDFLRFREFSKGEMLFLEGTAPDNFFLLEQGRVKVYLNTPDGREYILHLVESGQSFAEAAVLSMDHYPANAIALTDAETIMVPRRAFLSFLDENPQASRAIITGMSLWLKRLVDLTSLLSLSNVSERLARYIVDSAHQRKISLHDGTRLELDMKKTTLASRLGTVPETLSRNFAKLEEHHIIERDGKDIIVLDSVQLMKRAFPE